MNQTITPRKPSSVSPFRSLFSRSLIDDFFNQLLQENGNELTDMMNVSMDVAESEQAFEVKVDLPGIDPDNVDIQIDNNTLTIRGERQHELAEKDEDKQYHRVERYVGRFARSVVLPTSINEDETAAEFKNGVLKIVIPKTDESKPRKIRINS